MFFNIPPKGMTYLDLLATFYQGIPSGCLGVCSMLKGYVGVFLHTWDFQSGLYIYIYIHCIVMYIIIHMLEGPNHTIHTKPFRETKGISAAGGQNPPVTFRYTDWLGSVCIFPEVQPPTQTTNYPFLLLYATWINKMICYS